MKKTLLIITLFITGICLGQTYDQIVETYDNGLPKVVKTYKVVEGKLQLVKEINWYPNGQKSVEGKWEVLDGETFKHNRKMGKWTFWHENGQKWKEGSYTLWLNVYNNDTTFSYPKDDKWTYWYENGQKSSVTTWELDEIISSKCWDEDGDEKECN
jgi:antitoxin component YwqK of YwqJK toxin-antitoxin module|tara:strand:+ start:66 stop:533 length:468 start_codon:yes stop_codon:yes gene_type:complete